MFSKGIFDKTVGRTNYLRIAKTKSPISISPLAVDKKEQKKEVEDFIKNRLALFGMAIVISMIIVALLAPVIQRYDPLQQNMAVGEQSD
jgi:ABC-type dipeptide/oligopeptide/nickel transport system permease subunit